LIYIPHDYFVVLYSFKFIVGIKMKINGQEVSGPAEEVLVLPRSNGDIVFTARAVLDMEPFDAQCPPPKAPGMLTKEGFQPNTNSPNYRAELSRHSELRFSYILINSLQGIDWDTVNEDDPGTWGNWEKDLKKAGFNGVEIQRITVLVMQANALDEGKLRAARESFLLGQGLRQALLSGHSTEQSSTQSGPPANDSE
jgi:hypothetical protein